MFLSNFPITIDPSVELLEVQLSEEKLHEPGKCPPGSWTHLYRIPPPSDAPFPVDSRSVHFFGPTQDLDRCAFVLIYDAAGVWRYLAMREGPTAPWIHTAVPGEMSGLAAELPSVRIMFDDPAVAARVMKFLRNTLMRSEAVTQKHCDEFIAAIRNNMKDVILVNVARSG